MTAAGWTATIVGESGITSPGNGLLVVLTVAAIPGEVDAVVSTANAFFVQDDERKARVQWSGQGTWAGWQPLYAQDRPMPSCLSASR